MEDSSQTMRTLFPFELTFRCSFDRASMLASYSNVMFDTFDKVLEEQFSNRIVKIRPHGKHWYACAYRPDEDSEYSYFGVFTGMGKFPSWAETIAIVTSPDGTVLNFVDIKADGLDKANELMENYTEGRF